jgi:hypothetical protein
MQYGLPENRRHLIDTEIPDEITYTDAILYLSRFLKKRPTYLELGVSVGKNFLQVANALKGSALFGFDVEDINPTLEAFFSKLGRVEWETNGDSEKKGKSSCTAYRYLPNQNSINYVSGDVFDEKSWVRLSGTRFNLVFSDAFHSPEALLHEQTMLTKYDLLDPDEFILVWDDLTGPMENAFEQIWTDLRRRFNLSRSSKVRLLLNGWLGLRVHEVGLIMRLGT